MALVTALASRAGGPLQHFSVQPPSSPSLASCGRGTWPHCRVLTLVCQLPFPYWVHRLQQCWAPPALPAPAWFLLVGKGFQKPGSGCEACFLALCVTADRPSARGLGDRVCDLHALPSVCVVLQVH